MTPDAEKNRLRADNRALRRALDVAAMAGLAGHVAALVDRLGLEPARDAIAGYWPLDGEADLRPALDLLHGRGFLCALPVVVRPHAPLVFRAWRPGLEMTRGPHGSREPGPGEPEVVPRLVLVPLVAFDRAGGRLGMGGGYYDRTLEMLRAAGPVTAAGIGYAAQEVPALPGEAHDQEMDWLVTENGIIEPGTELA